jgi:SPP1 family phage portal protein
MYKNGMLKANYEIPIDNISYSEKTVKDKELNSEIQKSVDDVINQIYWNNDEDILVSQLGEDQIKYGVAYELLYTTGDKIEDIQIAKLNPAEIEIVYTNDLKPKKLAVVRYFTDAIKKTEYYEIYYKDRIEKYYKEEADKEFKQAIYENGKTIIKHNFGDIPIVEYSNNSDNISDITSLFVLNDQFDISMTELFFNDQSIPLTHVEFSKASNTEINSKKELKEFANTMKAIPITPTSKQDGESRQNIYYHNRIVDTAYLDFLFKIAKETIEYISGIPNLQELITNYRNEKSVESILYVLEIKASEKEAYFKLGYYYRLKLLSNILNYMKIDNLPIIDYNNFSVRFERNIPNNITDKIDNLLKLLGLLDDDDIIKMLAPLIDKDPEELIKNKEKRQDIDINNLYEENDNQTSTIMKNT